MPEETFFDFAAEVGLTKHIGESAATDALAALCGITRESHVLDVGCGAGVTPCQLARQYSCRVTGVDIRQRMVERSRERASREGLTDLVDFQVADAQDLPFPDGTFDAVITESVTAFPPDKARAVREYARVTRPGGCVGLNETTWLKTPVPPEIVAWAEQDVGDSVKPLIPVEWVGLLQGAGLAVTSQEVFPVIITEESRGILQRYGLGGMLGSMWRALKMYLRNQAYRDFVRSAGKQGVIPPGLTEYFGYGLFVGRK